MTRYRVEIFDGELYCDCSGPLFNSATEALVWGFWTFPEYLCRAVPAKFSS